MEDNIILNLSSKEIKVIKGSLLVVKETLNMTPFKNKDIKNKIIEINNLIERIELII